ncbi:MAG: hypothetical protein IJ235_00630 [Eubacterium sp.]|nr:hypothetical protein [Eubacterium sp.]MBR2278224.1 hypothetical protein [Eubacterium sp.]
MSLKNKAIIEEYLSEKDSFVKLGDIVSSMLKKELDAADIDIMAVEHRVKEEQSLEGKLELKGEKYKTLSDITDILGARVICFFSDDVNKVATIVENLFDIDWSNSVNKRNQLTPEAFGYLSLHYICTLPVESDYPEELKNKKFEVQIRSTLQHTWAEISHDLGYKSEFGVPKKVTRELSRVAGLLEIADDQFISIRNDIQKYGEEVEQLLEQGKLGEVLIDLVTLTQYLETNENIKSFTDELVKMSGAKRRKFSPESYIEQLTFLGKKTIGDIEIMLYDNREKALKLARHTFETTELKYISSNISLYFLCRAELLDNGYSLDDITKFMNITTKKLRRAQHQAEQLLNMNFI